MKYDLFYGSKGGGRIHGSRWEPQGEPKGVVQIVHGIAEHIERFESLAVYLSGRGYVVVAEDHMGHGRSIGEECPRGCFRGGWFAAVEDIRTLMKYTMGKYPGLPYVMIGISEGSFMVRTLLAKYPDMGLNGAVLCGTSWLEQGLLNAVKLACSFVCGTAGEEKPGTALQKLMFSGYNRGVSKPQSPHAWLCRDEDVVAAYDEDPLCGFAATAGLYRDTLEGIAFIQNPCHLATMDKSLPVLFLAGEQDPVGNYGKGVTSCADAFQAAGMEQVTVKLYPEDRHDVLNELDKLTVWTDLVNWIESTAMTIKYDLMD